MHLLVVDDEPAQRRMLTEFLEEQGHEVRSASAMEEALAMLLERPPDLVLTDVRLPGRDGVELIREARAAGVPSAFLVLTAFGTIEGAVEAMRAGAYDYLTKPVHLDDLERAIARRQEIPAEPDPDDPFEGLGAAMSEVVALVDRIAASDVAVLVRGESGTGKELLARRLHARSARAKRPMLAVNCAALTESLLESELFGHEAGAFTGAQGRRAGLFESADGGTILLDEIGDVSAGLQVRLLRVLQEREVTRVGSHAPVPVDFRLVAATNRDLDALVADGSFRQDLLYRLKVVEVVIPPLRDRPEDIPVLAARLLPGRPLSADALAALTAHPLPGNVRQLEHLLQRAALMTDAETITADDLALDAGAGRSLNDAVEALERRWIEDALRQSGGVRSRAAARLGLPDRVLRYKMKKYEIEPPGAGEG